MLHEVEQRVIKMKLSVRFVHFIFAGDLFMFESVYRFASYILIQWDSFQGNFKMNSAQNRIQEPCVTLSLYL